MIPSMDAFGGWGGFLGIRPGTAPDTKTLGELRMRGQRYPDTFYVSHANFLRDRNGTDLGPLLERPDTGPVPLKVALIGDGIANMIAAYELSRCGLEVTTYDLKGVTPQKPPPFGGRMTATAIPDVDWAAELGAKAFPDSSPLLWHYLWRAAIYRGQDPVTADALVARRYPNPGVVPTRVCYQDKWFTFTPDLSRLPGIVQEAACLFRDWLRGLHNGVADPNTVYLTDVMKAAKLNAPSDDLYSFWAEMKRRYAGRSIGSVLMSEAFATGTRRVDLWTAFAQVGVGTGGFAPVYDIGCLELIKQVVWDYGSTYRLPDIRQKATDDTMGVGGYVSQDLAADLAQMALQASQSCFPSRTFADMFKFDAPITSVSTETDVKLSVSVRQMGQKDPKLFDLAIIGMSSRAMQALGIAHDTPSSPFNTNDARHTAVSRAAVKSVQAAIHQLNMISGYKSFAQIEPPTFYDNWPRDSTRAIVDCFVTDRFPRVTTTMPRSQGTPKSLSAAAEAWGADARRFESAAPDSRLRRAASVFKARGGELPGGYVEVADALYNGEFFTDQEWTKTPGVGGAVKLDHPGDQYFSGSLYYHCQLATEINSHQAPWGRTFLAGDSVGYLGGWAEGAAMSSLGAITAVLYQARKLVPKLAKATLRSSFLVENRDNTDHTWIDFGGDIDPLPAAKMLTLRPTYLQPELRPPLPRIDDVVPDGDRWAGAVRVAPNGRWLLDRPGNVYRWRRYEATMKRWSAPKEMISGFTNVSIAAAFQVPSDPAGIGQVVGIHPQRNTLNVSTYVPQTVHGFEQWRRLGTEADTFIDDTGIVVDGGNNTHIIAVPADRRGFAYWRGTLTGQWDSTRVFTDMQPIKVAIANPAGSLVVAFIDKRNNAIYLTGRDPSGPAGWSNLVAAWPPTNGLQARLISLFATNVVARVRLVAAFSDGNVYQRVVDVFNDQSKYLWQPIGYPATKDFTATDMAVSRSINPCDPADSFTVRLLSAPTPSTAQREEQAS